MCSLALLISSLALTGSSQSFMIFSVKRLCLQIADAICRLGCYTLTSGVCLPSCALSQLKQFSIHLTPAATMVLVWMIKAAFGTFSHWVGTGESKFMKSIADSPLTSNLPVSSRSLGHQSSTFATCRCCGQVKTAGVWV